MFDQMLAMSVHTGQVLHKNHQGKTAILGAKKPIYVVCVTATTMTVDELNHYFDKTFKCQSAYHSQRGQTA